MDRPQGLCHIRYRLRSNSYEPRLIVNSHSPSSLLTQLKGSLRGTRGPGVLLAGTLGSDPLAQVVSSYHVRLGRTQLLVRSLRSPQATKPDLLLLQYL